MPLGLVLRRIVGGGGALPLPRGPLLLCIAKNGPLLRCITGSGPLAESEPILLLCIESGPLRLCLVEDGSLPLCPAAGSGPLLAVGGPPLGEEGGPQVVDGRLGLLLPRLERGSQRMIESEGTQYQRVSGTRHRGGERQTQDTDKAETGEAVLCVSE